MSDDDITVGKQTADPPCDTTPADTAIDNNTDEQSSKTLVLEPHDPFNTRLGKQHSKSLGSDHNF